MHRWLHAVAGLCLATAWLQSGAVTSADNAGALNAAPTRAAIETILAPDSGRGVPRVPRVTLDPTGDLTVVFAMRDIADDPKAIGAGGLDDMFAILHAAYTTDTVHAIRTATVLGTYAVWGKFGSTRELPLMRATLSAERAGLLDWCYLRPTDLPTIAEDWWMQEDIRPHSLSAGADGPRASSCVTGARREAVEGMLLHLNNALHALSANEVGLSRSQFKQFFDLWDNLDDEFLKPNYPDAFPEMDRAEQQVEIALLHSQPEDLVGARGGLLTLRTDLLDVVRSLEAP